MSVLKLPVGHGEMPVPAAWSRGGRRRAAEFEQPHFANGLITLLSQNRDARTVLREMRSQEAELPRSAWMDEDDLHVAASPGLPSSP
jgi:hypothetical protein